MMPPAGDLAALPLLRVAGSGGRGDGPPISQRTTAAVPQASSSTKKLAGSAFPSQQPLLCQEKNQVSPLGENRAGSKRPKAIRLWRSNMWSRNMPSLARAPSQGL